LASVIDSELPCSIDDAVKLAGLQCQVTYGDHKNATHVVGFLTYEKDIFALNIIIIIIVIIIIIFQYHFSPVLSHL